MTIILFSCERFNAQCFDEPVDVSGFEIYFTLLQKNGSSQLVTFYKMESEDPEPKPFFSISKTL